MDVFRGLGCGIRFDRKRYGEQIDLFRGKKLATDASKTSLLPSVDFFAANDNAPIARDDHAPERAAIRTDVESSLGEQDVPVELSSVEQIAIFRKKHRIRVYGPECPPPVPSFAALHTEEKVHSFLLKNVMACGYKKPTPIQMQAIPILLQDRDLIACAPTGSGKTMAFILPILQKLSEISDSKAAGIRAVVISPTRELAQQIYREFSRMAGNKTKISLLSKANLKNSEKKYDILVSTPLRLVSAIRQQVIDLNSVNHLVVDEADKLFEMGFVEQLDEIISACTATRIQKALFSATISSQVESLANNVLKEPIRVVIGQNATELIAQKLLYVGQENGKLVAIRQLIQQGIKPPVLIFVDSVERAKELFHELVYDGINVDVIHSDRTQAQRETIMKNFRLGKIWVLIATDLLGRGVDFKGINMVINYDFPPSVASYIHRIGRTGRAGRAGEAITYFTEQDASRVRSIANVMKESGCDVPEWMLKLPKNQAKKQKRQDR